MHSWFRSYMSDRSQLVAVHGVTSHPVPVFSGVPQGSVLGPLLFLIYVNDLCLSNFTTNSSLVLYTDDTTLYKPLSQPSDLSNFQADINAIHNWFSSNQLTANAAKTKSMVISTKKDPFPDMILHLNNQPIERVSSTKFLGIWITQNLSWNLQVDHICKKARRPIGFIHRAFHSAQWSVPAVFSIWLWYDLSWNMGAPPGTHSINPLPTALNHVKGLPVGLSFSLGKHLMKIFFPSRTFLYCLNVVTSPPSVIYSKLSMICVHLQIHSSLIPVLISGTSTPGPWIPLFAVWPCPRDHFIHMPLRFGTTSLRKLSSASLCHPSRRLFIPILCNHRLSHLVLFGPV